MNESACNITGIVPANNCRHGAPFAAVETVSYHEQRRVKGPDGQWLKYDDLWVVVPAAGGTWVRAKYLDANGMCHFGVRANQIEQEELHTPLPDDFATPNDQPHLNCGDRPIMRLVIVPEEWVDAVRVAGA